MPPAAFWIVEPPRLPALRLHSSGARDNQRSRVGKRRAVIHEHHAELGIGHGHGARVGQEAVELVGAARGEKTGVGQGPWGQNNLAAGPLEQSGREVEGRPARADGDLPAAELDLAAAGAAVGSCPEGSKAARRRQLQHGACRNRERTAGARFRAIEASVPLSTSSVPLLLSATLLTVVVPVPPVFSIVPALTIVPPPGPSTKGVPSDWMAYTAPASLFNSVPLKSSKPPALIGRSCPDC